LLLNVESLIEVVSVQGSTELGPRVIHLLGQGLHLFQHFFVVYLGLGFLQLLLLLLLDDLLRGGGDLVDGTFLVLHFFLHGLFGLGCHFLGEGWLFFLFLRVIVGPDGLSECLLHCRFYVIGSQWFGSWFLHLGFLLSHLWSSLL